MTEDINPRQQRALNFFAAGKNLLDFATASALVYYLAFVALVPAVLVGVIVFAGKLCGMLFSDFACSIFDKLSRKNTVYNILSPVLTLIFGAALFFPVGVYGKVSKGFDALTVVYPLVTLVLWQIVFEFSCARCETCDASHRHIGHIWRSAGAVLALFAIPVGLIRDNTYGFLTGTAVLILAGSVLFAVSLPLIKYPSCVEKTNLSISLKTLFKTTAAKKLTISILIGALYPLLWLAAMPVLTYRYASGNVAVALIYLGVFGGAYFTGTLISAATFGSLEKKYELKKLYTDARIITGISLALVFVMYFAFNDVTKALCVTLTALCILAAGAAKAVSDLSVGALCEIMDENLARPFGKVKKAINVFSVAVSALILGIALQIMGFTGMKTAEINAFLSAGGNFLRAIEYASFIRGLFIVALIIPALSSLLAIIPVLGYSLDEEIKKGENLHNDEKENLHA